MRILCLIYLLSFISCISPKNEIEYIRFEYRDSISRKNKNITIVITPARQNSKRVLYLALNYHGKEYSKIIIQEEAYNKIVNNILEIEKEEIGNKKEIVMIDGECILLNLEKEIPITYFYAPI